MTLCARCEQKSYRTKPILMGEITYDLCPWCLSRLEMQREYEKALRNVRGIYSQIASIR